MLEVVNRTLAQATEPPRTVLEIIPLGSRTAFRLKSLRVGSYECERPVTLAGQRLPPVCQTTSKPLRALGIGPGDWLIIPPEALAVTLRQGVHPEIEGQDLSLLEITDALSTLAITGRGAEAVLSTDCGLDWSPDRFPVGQCARTRFANVPVIVEKVDDLPRFELTVGSSYLAYLTAWLADAVSLYCTSDCE